MLWNTFAYMAFPLSIQQGSTVFHLLADQIFVDTRVQRYKIWPLKEPDKYLILENNKPLIRNKLKLKNRKIDWRIIEHTGPKISRSTVQQYVNAIILHYAPPVPEKKVQPVTPVRTRKEGMKSPTTTIGQRNGMQEM
jgi:hypothetical protein